MTDKPKYIIESNEGFVKSADGRFHEPNHNITYTNNPEKAKTFVSHKTTRRWAQAYNLQSWAIDEQQHAIDRLKARHRSRHNEDVGGYPEEFEEYLMDNPELMEEDVDRITNN